MSVRLFVCAKVGRWKRRTWVRTRCKNGIIVRSNNAVTATVESFSLLWGSHVSSHCRYATRVHIYTHMFCLLCTTTRRITLWRQQTTCAHIWRKKHTHTCDLWVAAATTTAVISEYMRSSYKCIYVRGEFVYVEENRILICFTAHAKPFLYRFTKIHHVKRQSKRKLASKAQFYVLRFCFCDDSCTIESK